MCVLHNIALKMTWTFIKILTVSRFTFKLLRLKTRKKRNWTSDSISYWVYSSTRHTNKRNLPCIYIYILIFFSINIIKYFRYIVNFYKSRAISTTRTLLRLNTNQSHAYEDCLLECLNLVVQLKTSSNQTYCTHFFQRLTSG